MQKIYNYQKLHGTAELWWNWANSNSRSWWDWIKRASVIQLFRCNNKKIYSILSLCLLVIISTLPWLLVCQYCLYFLQHRTMLNYAFFFLRRQTIVTGLVLSNVVVVVLYFTDDKLPVTIVIYSLNPNIQQLQWKISV
jgi:hypothetical protein